MTTIDPDNLEPVAEFSFSKNDLGFPEFDHKKFRELLEEDSGKALAYQREHGRQHKETESRNFLLSAEESARESGRLREWPEEIPDDPVDLLEEYIEYKGWEQREAQFGITDDFAEEYFAAFEAGDATEGIDVVVHAPVGTGKSLFGIVAIVAGKSRGILASSSKSLQAQYVDKDLPDFAEFMREKYGFELRFNILKGKSNYAHMKNLSIALTGKDLDGKSVEVDETFRRMSSHDREILNQVWDQTEMGMESVAARGDARMLDVGALLDQLEDSRLRFLCSASAPGGNITWSYWRGTDGPQDGVVPGDAFHTAFFAAVNSDIAVANHSLIASDVVRCELLESMEQFSPLTTPGFVRGAHTIIVDEAQHFPHFVMDSLTRSFHMGKLFNRLDWCRDNGSTAVAQKFNAPAVLDKVSGELEKVGDFIMDAYQNSDGSEEDGTLGVLSPDEMWDLCTRLVHASEVVRAAEGDLRPKGFEMDGKVNFPGNIKAIKTELLDGIANSLGEAQVGDRKNCDINGDPYYEVRISMSDPDDPETAEVHFTPLNISVFRSKLRNQQVKDSYLALIGGTARVDNPNRAAALVLMSGTISKKAGIRIGMKDPLMSRVDSPFDPNRIKFCVPDDIPVPNSPSWAAEACERVVEAIEAVNGRTMVLCTSRRMQDEFVRAIRQNLPGIRVISQGETPKDRAVELFALEENSVLVGVKSFWEGVDVPGTACSLVIMDKIYFPIVNDPITSAMSRAADRIKEGSGFYEVSVDHGAFMLAQGAGRLIRKESDLGGVLILDPRLTTKTYGKSLLEMAPQQARFTPNYDDFVEYLGELREHIEEGADEPGEPGDEWIPLAKAGVRGGGARRRSGGSTKGSRKFVAVKSKGNTGAKGVTYRR